MFAFGCGDQLNHFFRAAEPFLNAVGVGAESFRGESGGHTRVGKSRVFCDEADLIDADAGIAAIGEMDSEAIGKGSGLRARFHEALYEIREIFALNTRQETDAGHPGGVEEISETAFGGAGFQRDAVEKELGAGGAKEQASCAGRVHGCAEFLPGGVKLACRARVL